MINPTSSYDPSKSNMLFHPRRRADIRLGPHKMSVIRRGSYASTYAKDEEALMKKQSHAAQVALASEIA
ncbi:unnamed protein product [Bursaphelenchus xylophilus]|uniref:(pine wood nematode) hypothetical protein n=1 Tax=Bursaphelenchus xylophilus TaxID=6326 RepID=A0A1I7SBB8_BURXY|nr:unnamed protein product [Bursaphelenchus xylophilus]CAG9131977.1 unnamed protein product [Bursaphelenchus xylophilus]